MEKARKIEQLKRKAFLIMGLKPKGYKLMIEELKSQIVKIMKKK